MWLLSALLLVLFRTLHQIWHSRDSNKTSLTPTRVMRKSVIIDEKAQDELELKLAKSTENRAINGATPTSYFTATKSNVDDKVGFKMRQVDDEVIILAIGKDSLFPSLQVGQVLVEVNDHLITSVDHAYKLLKATDLNISVKSSNKIFFFSATKESTGDKVGLTMKQVGTEVYIVAVSDRCIFSGVPEGLVIAFINGHPVENIQSANKLLKATNLQIAVKKSRNKVFLRKATKKHPDDKVGFTMRKVGSEVKLLKLKESTIFPDLQEGMVLISINGKQIQDVDKASELLRAKELAIVVKE